MGESNSHRGRHVAERIDRERRACAHVARHERRKNGGCARAFIHAPACDGPWVQWIGVLEADHGVGVVRVVWIRPADRVISAGDRDAEVRYSGWRRRYWFGAPAEGSRKRGHPALPVLDETAEEV